MATDVCLLVLRAPTLRRVCAHLVLPIALVARLPLCARLAWPFNPSCIKVTVSTLAPTVLLPMEPTSACFATRNVPRASASRTLVLRAKTLCLFLMALRAAATVPLVNSKMVPLVSVRCVTARALPVPLRPPTASRAALDSSCLATNVLRTVLLDSLAPTDAAKRVTLLVPLALVRPLLSV